MNQLEETDYNLELTLLGGQSFTWDKKENFYIGTYKETLIVIEKKDTQIFWQTYPEKDNLELLSDYLNIKNEVNTEFISKDEHIMNAVNSNPGLRILRQDYETTLLNFILSSHKSVKGVRKLVKDISNKYGKQLVSPQGVAFSFPSAEIIANLSEKELRDIGAGFRAPYLKAAAAKLVKDRDSMNLENMKTIEVKKYLTSFVGIGDKIADCILVFGLGRYNITPLDIWAKRVLVSFYKLDPRMSYQEMSNWYSSYFGKETAIAGQFLFEYIRNQPIEKQTLIS